MPFRGRYQGSSFSELLDIDFTHIKVDFAELAQKTQKTIIEAPHGTTVLALRLGDGVLVAGDRLATAGYQVASREVEKVFATDDHSLIAIAGAAGPAIAPVSDSLAGPAARSSAARSSLPG